jgi:hypothetical protein
MRFLAFGGLLAAMVGVAGAQQDLETEPAPSSNDPLPAASDGGLDETAEGAPMSAAAAEDNAPPPPAALEPPIDDNDVLPGAPAASELDALSQGAEDPFPDIEMVEKRKPLSVTVRALDKVTARYKDLEVAIGEPVKFQSLEIVPRYCDKRPPEDFPETTAFLEVFDRDLARARAAASVVARDIDAGSGIRRRGGKVISELAPAETASAEVPASLDPDRIFAGWMFASTPALNALEHPVYDVWVIDCKTVAAGS